MTFGVTALVVASVGTVASIAAGEKARSAQSKAGKIQERIRQTQDARSRIAQVRQARMAQAQVTQSGATQGAMGSSAVQGGIASIGTNANNNIQFINQTSALQEAVNSRMSSASNWQGAASAFAGVASIAGSFSGGAAPQRRPVTPTGGMSNAGGQSSTIAGRGPFNSNLPPSPFGN